LACHSAGIIVQCLRRWELCCLWCGL